MPFIFLIMFLLAPTVYASSEWRCLLCDVQTTYVYEKSIVDGRLNLVADQDVAVQWKSQAAPSLKWIKKISKEKEKSLAIVGIKKWHLSDNKWLAYTADRKVLQLDGYYVDRKNRKNHFRELHYFNKSASLRALLTSESATALKNETAGDIERFLASEMRKKK